MSKHERRSQWVTSSRTIMPRSRLELGCCIITWEFDPSVRNDTTDCKCIFTVFIINHLWFDAMWPPSSLPLWWMPWNIGVTDLNWCQVESHIYYVNADWKRFNQIWTVNATTSFLYLCLGEYPVPCKGGGRHWCIIFLFLFAQIYCTIWFKHFLHFVLPFFHIVIIRGYFLHIFYTFMELSWLMNFLYWRFFSLLRNFSLLMNLDCYHFIAEFGLYTYFIVLALALYKVNIIFLLLHFMWTFIFICTHTLVDIIGWAVLFRFLYIFI